MSDAKVIVKLNLKPVGQYAQGNSLIVQGDTTEEVAELLGQAVGQTVEQGKVILESFGLAALGQAVKVVLEAPTAAATAEASASTKAAAPAVGADPDAPASPALLAVVASKTGKSVEELGALTTKEAKQKLAIANKKAKKEAE